jgi:hypothetical protein
VLRTFTADITALLSCARVHGKPTMLHLKLYGDYGLSNQETAL